MKKQISPFSIYKKSMYTNGTSNMCAIHDAFGNSENTHNCVACNLADFSDLLLANLKRYQKPGPELERFSVILWSAYLIVERMEEIFQIIEINPSYKARHFKIFGKIKRWANFLKHPKAFMLVHHPEFIIQSDPPLSHKEILLVFCQHESDNKYIFIDQDFIDEYYAGSNNNHKLYSLLTNRKGVFVVFPEIRAMIKELSDAQNRFVQVIQKNEVYRELLENKSVLRDYFGAT